MNHLDPLAAMAAEEVVSPTAKSVIYIFLSGGLAQHESFDPKPDAPEDVRGEFKPIQTQTPGVLVSEHLPLLAQRSNHWAILRSLTHPYNEHSAGHHVMLTGRSDLPPGFSGSRPNPTDHPCIASMVSKVLPRRNNLTILGLSKQASSKQVNIFMVRFLNMVFNVGKGPTTLRATNSKLPVWNFSREC